MVERWWLISHSSLLRNHSTTASTATGYVQTTNVREGLEYPHGCATVAELSAVQVRRSSRVDAPQPIDHDRLSRLHLVPAVSAEPLPSPQRYAVQHRDPKPRLECDTIRYDSSGSLNRAIRTMSPSIETWNIWTHLSAALGCIYLLWRIWHSPIFELGSEIEKILFAFYILSAQVRG